MAAVHPPHDRPRASDVGFVALVAGLTAAVIEMVPVLPIQAALGVPPGRLFQAIAGGVLGPAAFRKGAASVLLGVGLHTLISLAAALVYGVVTVWFAVPLRRPITGGLVFGIVVYLVMTAVVLPLSALPPRAPPSPPLLALSFAIHLLFFGLPIALVTARLRPDVHGRGAAR